MANLIITPSQVLTVPSGGGYEQGVAGETILAGKAVYFNTGQCFLADAARTLAVATVRGISLHSAFVGQPLRIQVSGDITLGVGASPVVGMIYVLSATDGLIASATDLVSGMWSVVLGIGQAGNVLHLSIIVSGQQIP